MKYNTTDLYLMVDAHLSAVYIVLFGGMILGCFALGFMAGENLK